MFTCGILEDTTNKLVISGLVIISILYLVFKLTSGLVVFVGCVQSQFGVKLCSLSRPKLPKTTLIDIRHV